MSTKTKTGTVVILVCALVIVLLFGGMKAPFEHLHSLRISGNWGGLLWVTAPPLLMLTLFILLIRVVFMQKE